MNRPIYLGKGGGTQGLGVSQNIHQRVSEGKMREDKATCKN